MLEDMIPTPCPCCDGITDFIGMTTDPLGEYGMICTACVDDRVVLKEQDNTPEPDFD